MTLYNSIIKTLSEIGEIYKSMVRNLVTVILLTVVAPANARAQELDRYGGWKDVLLTASGAFRIEEIGGRDLLVTPDGHPYLAIGINHLGAIMTQST